MVALTALEKDNQSHFDHFDLNKLYFYVDYARKIEYIAHNSEWSPSFDSISIIWYKSLKKYYYLMKIRF